MARDLNRVTLIGNLTRDPELRYTPQGTAVCTFSVATNRQWKLESGETKEDAEFHRIVAWDKLAEICSQMLGKGKRVFVEGRLQTRKWTSQDGQPKITVEIVITDMILLDRGKPSGEVNTNQAADEYDMPDDLTDPSIQPKAEEEGKEPKKGKDDSSKENKEDDSQSEDIPF